ncbi:adenylate kinase [bacterium]|nr:adenylate kinase [candidate division CSSED10-310 bacterium]
MRLVVLGPPGVGKGTQTKMLKESLALSHISTGDILRDNVKRNTVLGQAAAGYMNSGRLVPDELVIDMVDERLNWTDCATGFILDGYPRTRGQAEALRDYLLAHGQPLDGVIYIDVPTPVIVLRLSGRRVCEACGAIYHVTFSPSAAGDHCERCGSMLVQRPDDQAEAIQKRIAVYKENLQALLDFYREGGLLFTIDGSGAIEEIHEEILAKLGKRSR